MSPSHNSTGGRVAHALLCCLALVSTAACHRRVSTVSPAPATDSVATGYGTQPREHVGGAVQTLSARELANLRVRRVEELLAGRVAGVRVIPTANGGFLIRIRGITSRTGETEPLYVVDGMVVQVDPSQGLNWLNPADIERIDALKDAAETSMYGVRGANGVILIKTKRGSR